MNLVEWLAGDACNATDVSQVTVTIKGTTYQGARYTQQGDERLYLIGPLPACYQRSTRTVFRFDSDEHDWFLASWCPPAIAANPRYAHSHPFGQMFILTSWRGKGRIDQYERLPYTRVPAALG